MESTTEVLFGKMEILYENIYNLLNGFQQASVSNLNITVPIKKADGTIEQVSINSFQKLQQELTRIDSNFKSLINADNLSYTLEADGSISQQTKTSFINAEYLENFVINPTCIVDTKSTIDNLIYPTVKIPITRNSTIRSDVYCKIFEIIDGWSEIGENPTVIDINYLQQNGLINCREVNRTLQLEKNQVKYFGKFTTETLKQLTSNSFEILLNDTKYGGLNTLGNNYYLKVNDILVSKTGSSKYIINEIDKFTKICKLTRISGSEILTIGIENLYFNEIITENQNIVGIPVKPAQNIVIFLSTENFKNISFPSIGIKIDTTNYEVIYKDTTYTLDEFFINFVTNFSEYLIGLMNETAIPANLGIIPLKPVLNASNFKVIQINKHLDDSLTISEINKLNKQKQILLNDIDFKQKTIDKSQLEIDTQKFKSIEEKNYKLTEITSLKQQINVLKTNLLNVSKNIDVNAEKNGLKNLTPKYKIIGFWDIQNAIYSPLTQPQNIIKYEVVYRYLSKNVDTIENTSYNMINNLGEKVSVVFSPWNDLTTKIRNKIVNFEGKLVWETQILDSVEEININQLAISINDGESVELKIRAVSEAGYPISPIKSNWSEILRIDFPEDIKKSNISSTISQNSIDLNKAEFDNILQSYGLLTHISGTIKEGEKTFLHSSKDIASGQYTPEQKNIPLDTMIITLLKEINNLKSVNTLNNVIVSVTDFHNETFIVKNNSTIELFGGNYTDTVDILNQNNWGSIIRKKGYIKITNNNSVPIELKTLIPGNIFNSQIAPTYYNVPLKNELITNQKVKQIIYFRNIDLTNQTTDAFKLIETISSFSNTFPNNDDISQVAENERNVVYLSENGIITTCKLNPNYNTGFVAYTKEHPLYNKTGFINEFSRLKLYSPINKKQQVQSELQYNIDNGNLIYDTVQLIGFDDNDFYSIGKNTCGAFLYPIINNSNSISVTGDITTSTLIMQKESELLIPFVYEYRMTDRLGNIDGLL